MLILKGKLTQGAGPCQAFAADDGVQWSLVGELGGAALGDEVFVSGVEAEASPCGQGRTLFVQRVDKTLPSAVDPLAQVTRTIDVAVTFSSRDLSPRFSLEGDDLGLTFDNAGKWRGKFDSVSVTGKLDVVFVSKGFNGQKFGLTVTATNPASGKTKEETFQQETKKGVVSFREEMDV
jgi:hypothetical protein